jgi:hypothetical protein
MAARKNEWLEGRKVRLLRDMETRGGTKFPAGIVCLVTNVSRGDLWVKARNPDPNNIFGPRYITMRTDFRPWQIEVLPDDRPRCPWGCTHLSKVHAEDKEGCSEGRCACRWFPGTTEVDPEVEADHDVEEAFDAYDNGGRKEDKATKVESTHPDDLVKTRCDCGKVDLDSETEVRLEPYAKVVRVAAVPTAVKHAAAGCNKVDYLGLPVLRLKSKRR